MDPRAQHVLEFWFADAVRDPSQVAGRDKLWWAGGKAEDESIRTQFAADVASASAGELSAWTTSPHERLALIILLDQFRRSLHRSTAQAFTLDPLALELAQGGIANGQVNELAPLERVFMFMPLEHAESAQVQTQSVACFERLERDVPADQRALFANFAKFAREHRDLIARFGRFPHRNGVLGRPSTSEEVAYLNGGGRTFGQ
jgi:uncharacterized protein (DUF924 family)